VDTSLRSGLPALEDFWPYGEYVNWISYLYLSHGRSICICNCNKIKLKTQHNLIILYWCIFYVLEIAPFLPLKCHGLLMTVYTIFFNEKKYFIARICSKRRRSMWHSRRPVWLQLGHTVNDQ